MSDSGKLAMNSYAEKRLLSRDRASIEREIPDGYRMTVQAGQGAGDWSIRIYEQHCPDCAMTLVVTTRNHKTIRGGAMVALAKLATAAA